MLSQLLKQATTRKTTFSSPRAVIRGGLSGLTQGGSDTLEQPLGRFLASIDCSNGGDNSPRDSQHDDQNGSQNDRSVAQALDRTTVCVDSSVAPSIKEFLMPEETLILDVSELIKERVGASRHVQRLQRAVGGRRGALLDHLLRDRELGSVAADPHPEQQDDLTGRIEEDTCDAPAFMDPLLGFNSEGLSRQSLSTTDLLSAPVAQFCSLHERNGDLDRNTDYLHFVPIPTFVPKGTAFVKLHDDLDILVSDPTNLH
ncbi:hypothetical protein GNI_159690 [Gregarina niphandrodes]|uniref:Uncharacterized protein n=1 Tax=Gregarina niphandrodes TaxID=110365 RepID=A0A023AYM7_GRENI|nr:hypothetical protein GNI_159690 [Gregarina niphandrodes]EZG43772.1 hypothetical protein GNI_159690 [Gregarina niphandrodes]|eukprot:XP_011134620.1 hypothetical protein GNI_159690 [Gregarina niphandrodes]